MADVKMNSKPIAEDFAYAYVEDASGALVRVPKEKIITLGKDGGYYVPYVDTEGNLTWMASDESMPKVDVQNIKGATGDTGKSAYQVWLDAGNTGSEEDFLASLKGADGTNGYTPQKGTDYFDGKDGADGTSVTVTSVAESTEDGGENVVTFSDGKTLIVKNGSKGAQGEKGEKGDKGDTGATGATGAAGKNGSDASVTTENITAALGYTPAGKEEVSKLSEEMTAEKITMSYDAESKTLKFSRGG